MRQVFVSAVVAALVAAGVSFGMHRGNMLVRTVDVPSLNGLSAQTAQAVLDPAGLLLVVGEEREDARVQPGQILAQRPLPGSRLQQGASVSVVVARAPGLVKVPGVLGQPVGEVRLRLELARLALGRVEEQTHALLPAGAVIAQTPAENAEVRAGSAVDLTVSKGAEAVKVPAVVGRPQSRAKDLLAQAGLQVGKIRHAADDDHSPGIVLKQEPAANQDVAKGATVDLVVNE
jgi:serine/threonine-protein kinase